MKTHTFALRCFHLEVAYVTSAHVSLPRASRMSLYNFKGSVKCDRLMCSEDEENGNVGEHC